MPSRRASRLPRLRRARAIRRRRRNLPPLHTILCRRYGLQSEGSVSPRFRNPGDSPAPPGNLPTARCDGLPATGTNSLRAQPLRESLAVDPERVRRPSLLSAEALQSPRGVPPLHVADGHHAARRGRWASPGGGAFETLGGRSSRVHLGGTARAAPRARSTCASSRTFPGQAYSSSLAIASGAIASTGRTLMLRLRLGQEALDERAERLRGGGAAPGSRSSRRRAGRAGPRGMRPAWARSRRSRWVAARTRTSTGRSLLAPTARTHPLSRTWSSLAWSAGDISPISSSKRVPSRASSNRPARLLVAPVKAPRTCPNSSLSRRGSGRAAQLTLTNGFAARALDAWIARASAGLARSGLADDEDRGRGIGQPNEPFRGHPACRRLRRRGCRSPLSHEAWLEGCALRDGPPRPRAHARGRAPARSPRRASSDSGRPPGGSHRPPSRWRRRRSSR